jgi:hypothetical protein
MARGEDNYGIRIEGSATVVSGAMAAGPGARAEGQAHYTSAPIPADLEELRAAIGSLVEQLRSSPAGVDDPGAMAEVAASAAREAGKPKPDRHVLGGLLQALMAGVGNSAMIANALLAIQHAVQVLL